VLFGEGGEGNLTGLEPPCTNAPVPNGCSTL
jgi:hypothetical protein